MSRRSGAHGAIAITGMGCRFAGAPDLPGYWDLTRRGGQAFGPVPANRWKSELFFDENPRATDKSCVPAGAFIEDVRSFPALAFGIPPRRVETMDPQQRLALEVALQALDDAGLRADDLPRRSGVFMGVTATEFRTIASSRLVAQLMASGDLGDVDGVDPQVFLAAAERVIATRPFTAPGVLANMIAATVAQELRLHGPAYTVDAACASALIAVHDAVSQLRAGAIDVALAGGVYLCLTPEHHIAFSRIGAMSRSGACRPFDRSADGFLQGDGAGIVVLKRLSDALADGDRIHAVLHGSALNNDGGGDGPMAPIEEGQREVVRMAWEDAELDPALLGYIETHGTGTQVGDRIEVDGLMQSVGAQVRDAALGSSKANVGHTMSAAGIAGLIRAVLALRMETIPPMAGFEVAKEDLRLDERPFRIPKSPEPWTGADRHAAVSSFGFGGTNAHVVLSAAPERPATGAAHPQGVALRSPLPPRPELIRMSAPGEVELRALAARSAAAVEADPEIDPASFARVWRSRREQSFRAAFVAGTREELAATLRALGEGTRPEGVALGEALEEARLAWLFPGQGAQRVGMIAGLRESFPVMRETIAEVDALLAGEMECRIEELLYPALGDDPAERERAEERLTRTENCQPALFAVGAALARLLDAVGVEPAAVAGHSVGEFVAAHAARRIPLADAARFTAARGRAMAEVAGDPGAMVAVLADRDTVESLLVEGAMIANINHPRQFVVSGWTSAVEEVARRAEAKEIRAVRLTVSHGFHSQVFAGVDLAEAASAVEVSEGRCVLASCIDAEPHRSEAQTRGILARHAASPVDFVRALEQCREAGANVFLQVGAGGPLASFARGALGLSPTDVITLASDEEGDGGASLLRGLGALWTRGVALRDAELSSGGRPVSLPAEVLPREDYWPIKDTPQPRPKWAGETVRAKQAVTVHAEGAAPEALPMERAVAASAGGGAADSASDPLEQGLLDAVARVSAYPREALRLEMQLIDDLGFDSMMVADLSEELIKLVPGLQAIPRELFVNAPTLADLLDFARRGGDATEEIDDDAPLAAFQPGWALLADGAEVAGGGAVAPAADTAARTPGASEAAATAAAAAAKGAAPETVFVWGESGVLRDRVEAALRARGASLVALEEASLLVYVATNGPAHAASDVLASREELGGVSALLAPLEKLASAGRSADVLVVGAEGAVALEASAGAARALAREWSERRVRVVHVGAGLREEALEAALAGELDAPDRSLDVRVDVQGRSVRSLLRRAPEQASGWTPGPGERVLVTGGTRGIGAALAARLADAGAEVVLLGRGAPADEASALIARSEGRVKAARADVGDAEAMARVVAEHGPFTALVHSAGVIADGPLGSVAEEKAASVWQVKAEGWRNALQACGSSLRVALGVGSWAARFGNQHQLHYAAANAWMAGTAAQAPRGLRLVVSEFGPWVSSEMVSSIPVAVQAAMRQEGVDFVGEEAGLDALMEDLRSGSGVVVRGRRIPEMLFVREVSERLDVATHPYLHDHAIRGIPVEPLASVADRMARLLPLAEGEAVEVRDLVLFEGVRVDEPVAIRARIDGARAALLLGDRRAYTAWVAPFRGEVPALEVPTGDAPGTPTLEEFYARGTFHGPLLQGIVAAETLGEGHVVGRVRCADPAVWEPGGARNTYRIDPLAFDSALQLAAWIAWQRTGRGGTPFRMDRFVALRPMRGELRVVARFGEAEGDRFTTDVHFFDPQSGELVAFAEGVAAELRSLEEEGTAAGAADVASAASSGDANAPQAAASAEGDAGSPASQEDSWEGFTVKPEWKRLDTLPELADLDLRLQMAEAIGLQNPYFDLHDGTARNITHIGGRPHINFSSYNYLGLSGDPRIVAAVQEGVAQYGTSVSASRVASGERPFHRELEAELAAAHGCEDAIVFTAGHATNVTTIGHLFGKRDLILHDELIHDSALQGIKLAGSARRSFRHEDPAHLEEQLRKLRPSFERVLIIIEGVYSMDGDITNLPAFAALRDRYGALLMVDEAHSFGTVGKRGLGVQEHWGLPGTCADIWMGTMSKSLASCGGWIAGSAGLIRYLRYTAPGFVYSAGMPAAQGIAGLHALRWMIEEPDRVTELQENAAYFCRRLKEAGLDTGPARGESPVIPVITGDSMQALQLSQRLLARGFNAKPIVYPAVPDDAARLRFFLSSTHTQEELEQTVVAVAEELAAIRSGA